MTSLNAAAVYERLREFKDAISQLHAAQCVAIVQGRELAERMQSLESKLERIVEANTRLSVENDALLKALGLRALKAMTAPVRVDQAMIARLIEVPTLGPMEG